MLELKMMSSRLEGEKYKNLKIKKRIKIQCDMDECDQRKQKNKK